MSEGHFGWYRNTLHQYVSKEEISELLQKSNLKACLEIANTWGWIIFAFCLSAIWANPVAYFFSLWILGGKQLACAIIMHDASHDALFTSRKLNYWIGNVFGAFPIFHRLSLYKPYHYQHHQFTGTDLDPDLPLTTGYPAGAKSMLRKFMRDITGITGIKAWVGTLGMVSGLYEYALNGQFTRNAHDGQSVLTLCRAAVYGLAGPILFQALLFLMFYAIGKPFLYGLWIGAQWTTYPFCLRIRSMAEHSMTDDRLDPLRNTRSLEAGFLEKLLFAPHHVHYHAEHHLCMGVPPYHLGRLHELLVARGFFREAPLSKGYGEIIRKAFG